MRSSTAPPARRAEPEAHVESQPDDALEPELAVADPA